MTTGIKGVNNESREPVYLMNAENHRKDDMTIPPETNATWAYAWISQHSDKPLKLKTLRGTLRIWDEDWKIMYRWEHEGDDTVWKRGIKNEQDFRLKIDVNGFVFIDG